MNLTVIYLGGYIDLHVFHGGTLTALKYRDKILDRYVRPNVIIIGIDFILMDNNARPHLVVLAVALRSEANLMASLVSRPVFIGTYSELLYRHTVLILFRGHCMSRNQGYSMYDFHFPFRCPTN
ncbi:hypothetical protein TNCV_3239881 [Trichonephila clavipes]|nr:hypothetical protein TNCV_3239881 [Trichonephila clavipes]